MNTVDILLIGLSCVIGVGCIYLVLRSRKYRGLYEAKKILYRDERDHTGKLTRAYSSVQEACEARVQNIKSLHQTEIQKLTKERDEMKQTVTEKIFKKLRPLIEQTTIQTLAELGANKRAQRLSQRVLEKLEKDL